MAQETMTFLALTFKRSICLSYISCHSYLIHAPATLPSLISHGSPACYHHIQMSGTGAPPKPTLCKLDVVYIKAMKSFTSNR